MIKRRAKRNYAVIVKYSSMVRIGGLKLLYNLHQEYFSEKQGSLINFVIIQDFLSEIYCLTFDNENENSELKTAYLEFYLF